MAYSRRMLLSLLLGFAPGAWAGRAEAKRSAKQSRKRAKETRALAKREASDHTSLAKRHAQDRQTLNAGNAELDKARRADLADLTRYRQARTERVVMDGPTAAEAPKPGVKPVARGVDGAATPKAK